MLRDSVRASLAHVGLALREPEDFTLAWHRQAVDYRPEVWLALMLTAIAGTASYGMTMGIGQGVQAIAEKAALLTLAAGLAWAIPLPALYILGSLAGSRLRASTTLLAALVTTSWGGLGSWPRYRSTGFSAWRFRPRSPSCSRPRPPSTSYWR